MSDWGAAKARRGHFRYLVVCLDNRGFEASLERRTIYVAHRDKAAERAGMVRVEDESGDSYLYQSAMFASLVLPPLLRRRLLRLAR